MYKHHRESIDNVTMRLKNEDEVLAVLIGGSIAHGFEKETSDVDIMIIVSEEDYLRRFERGLLHYFETDSCTYEGGYADGKYVSVEFLKKVALKGSEPARFAFKDALCTYSRIEEVEVLLKEISKYPLESKRKKICSFYAQFQAWKWYCDEGIKHNNTYLLTHSISNLILFGGRMILAYNETLYPYHKWFLRVLSEVEDRPADLMNNIDNLLRSHRKEHIDSLFNCIDGFADWDVSELNWPNQFMLDSELNWLEGNAPVADM